MSNFSLLKGSRGEWYLVVQTGLFLLLILGPRSCQWPAKWQLASLACSGFLMVTGILFTMYAVVNLGRNLTPLPLPKENATLIVTGTYQVVRHPIYCGIILMAFGWGLWRQDTLTIFYALLLMIFFDIKSRFEERLLEKKFPNYAEYKKHVRKLIPFVY